MKKTPVLICADPGIDDFVALSLILDRPDFDILGIVALSGNVGLDMTLRNALAVTELMHRSDVPVLAGSAKPLCRPARTAAEIHGPGGMGKTVLLTTSLSPMDMDGADFIAEAVKTHPHELQLVSLGPLTDVALAFQRHPEIIPLVKDVLVMGGGIHLGNATPYAEFNIVADPEAAALVFASGAHVTMIGLDATHGCIIPRSAIAALTGERYLEQVVPTMLHDYCDVYKSVNHIEGMVIHDAITMVYLWHPEWFDRHEWHVHVALTEDDHLGQTVADETGESGKAANCTVVLSTDAEQVAGEIMEGLAAAIRKNA